MYLIQDASGFRRYCGCFDSSHRQMFALQDCTVGQVDDFEVLWRNKRDVMKQGAQLGHDYLTLVRLMK